MLVIKQFGPVTYAMGTLQEILAGTGIAAKVRALPNDVAGCTLEMGADGLWTGASVGTLTQVQADALVASGVLANVKTATPATVNGQQVTWGGVGVGWAGVNPTKLDRYLRIAMFGDSTADFCNLGTTDTEKMYLDFPGSGFNICSCWQSKATVLWWQPCLIVANGGWSGQFTQDFLNRGKNAYSSTRKAMQDVLRKRPDVVLMHGGSINDYSTFSSSTPQGTIDAVVSRHRQCVEFFTGAGIHVIDSGTYGYSMPVPNLSAICSIIVQTNAALKAMASQNPLWHFVDVSGVLHDGTGLYKAGISVDTVHLNGNGGFLLGSLEKQVLDTLFVGGASGDIAWDQQSDYANSNSNGPINQSIGHIGLTYSNKTEAGSYIVTADVTDYANSYISMSLNSPGTNALAGLLAGDPLIIEIYMAVRDSNGNLVNNLDTALRLMMADSTNTVQSYFDSGDGRTTNSWYSLQFSLPVDAVNLGSGTQIAANVKFPANGRYTVEFRPWRIRKYTPLNTLP